MNSNTVAELTEMNRSLARTATNLRHLVADAAAAILVVLDAAEPTVDSAEYIVPAEDIDDLQQIRLRLVTWGEEGE